MSATHILNIAGGIRCGRLVVRGFITQQEYNKLAGEKKLRSRMKSSVNHNCAYREGGKCYTFAGGRRNEVNCPRRKETVSGFCRDCTN